ncbi:hypothetical protein [Catenuloplanes indicus]|uniref:Uncharacterized protein n=1 Tax=Catenuloplanes indicus TaxID=137267 RepID=A0AAE3VV11_9ACTN|nr:hypothetical protein [Catenuloplanes indicus]MDQ0363742.1 hypothetical protein [Catenuloplanes indicus]
MDGASNGSRWTREAAVVVPVILGLWALVAAVEFSGVWIAQHRGPFSYLREVAYVYAVLLTAALALGVWRRGRPRWSIVALVLSAALAVPVLTAGWPRLSIDAYYRQHRADFAAAADANRLVPDDYYGLRLPPPLRHLSIEGAASRIGDGTGVLLPVWADYPDLPGAFVHPGGAPPTDIYRCYDSLYHFRWALGDGWYWFERDPVSWAAGR